MAALIQPPERKYPVPKSVITIMPYECNPLFKTGYDDPMSGAAHRWLMESSLFTGRRYYRLGTAGKFTAWFYPFCVDPVRWDTSFKLLVVYFISDDHMECPYGEIDRNLPLVDLIFGQMHGVCDKLEAIGTKRHVPAHSWKPYVLAAYACYDTVYAAHNAVQKRRFIYYLRNWFDGMIAESYDVQRERVFNSIEEFHEVRGKSVACPLILHLIEYAHALYVPEPEWSHPVFQRWLTTTTRLIVICNDMYSFEKEVLDAGSVRRAYNCVSALAQIDNISLTESMNRFAAEYMELEKCVDGMISDMCGAEWTSPDTRLFLQHNRHFIGGHWYVSKTLDRYHTMLDLKEFD